MPSFRSTLPDHEVVPEVGVQVVLSVLSCIVETATLSHATPVTVTFAEAITVATLAPGGRITAESVDEEASNDTELFTLGYGGVKVNRAAGPVAATVTAIDAVWDTVPVCPVTTTVYEPKAVPPIVQTDV